jgi:hypothetical protein
VTSPSCACVAAAIGVSPYRVETNATFWGDVLETRQQVSTEACATACTLWQRQGIPCAAWSWSPNKGTRQKGACRLLSRLTKEDKKGPKGNMAGAIGEPATTTAYSNTDPNSHERACPNSPFAGSHTAAAPCTMHNPNMITLHTCSLKAVRPWFSCCMVPQNPIVWCGVACYRCGILHVGAGE